MSDPFVGEIRMFAGNFAPRGWSLCDGQLIAINQNTALFSLLGTIYGGDGRTTFGLPDMRGRVPVHQGSGPGLSPQRLGSRFGAEQVALTTAQLPAHNHPVAASPAAASSPSPQSNVPAVAEENIYASGPPQAMANAIAAAGGSQAHANLAPTTCVNYIIALFGSYPSRN